MDKTYNKHQFTKRIYKKIPQPPSHCALISYHMWNIEVYTSRRYWFINYTHTHCILKLPPPPLYVRVYAIIILKQILQILDIRFHEYKFRRVFRILLYVSLSLCCLYIRSPYVGQLAFCFVYIRGRRRYATNPHQVLLFIRNWMCGAVNF